MGDIGAHFPDTDPAYKGIDSKILLRETVSKVCTEGWRLSTLTRRFAWSAPSCALTLMI